VIRSDGALVVGCYNASPMAADYFVLLQGDDPFSITNVVDIEAVQPWTPTQLRHLTPSGLMGFYQAFTLPSGVDLTTITDPRIMAFLALDSDGDGIPNLWELTLGISPTDPRDAGMMASGYNLTWLQMYQILSTLPEAYFAQASTNVVAGASNVAVQVAFTKPFSGKVYYTLGGTAVGGNSGTNMDYYTPSGSVGVANATSASLNIRLVPPAGVSLSERTLVISLSTSNDIASMAYSVRASASVQTVHILPSSQGVYLGSLTISNGLPVDAQTVKMAVRPTSTGGNLALFDVAGNPLLGDSFSVPVVADASGFQLSGPFSRVIAATPLGRNINLNLAFGLTTVTNTNSFTVPVTLTLGGLTGSGVSYSGQGWLNLVRVQ